MDGHVRGHPYYILQVVAHDLGVDTTVVPVCSLIMHQETGRAQQETTNFLCDSVLQDAVSSRPASAAVVTCLSSFCTLSTGNSRRTPGAG